MPKRKKGSKPAPNQEPKNRAAMAHQPQSPQTLASPTRDDQDRPPSSPPQQPSAKRKKVSKANQEPQSPQTLPSSPQDGQDQEQHQNQYHQDSAHPQQQTLTLTLEKAPPQQQTLTLEKESKRHILIQEPQSPKTLISSQDLDTAPPPPSHPPPSPPPPAAVSPKESSPPPSLAVPIIPDVAMVTENPPPPAVIDVVPDSPARDYPSPTPRRGPGGKQRKPLTAKQLAAISEKLELLRSNFRPVPFAPSWTPDFRRHERLFRAAGLWDFANLDLGRDPLRHDLLILLIANYNSQHRCSYVCGARVMVSRADIARALVLPMKGSRDRAMAAAPSDADLALFSEPEAIAVLTNFLDWMVVMEEDACELPADFMEAQKQVKEKNPHKVDWAGLVWNMVEKELQDSPRSGQCCYASHLQRLIKHQRADLFTAEAEPDKQQEQPELPQQPEQPEEPVQPKEPEQPKELEQLEQPKEPEQLEQPKEPEQPMEPEQPEQPRDPEQPMEPEQPEQPMEITWAEEEADAAKMIDPEDTEDINCGDDHGPGLSLGLGTEIDGMIGFEGEDEGASQYMRNCSFNNVSGLEGCNGEDAGTSQYLQTCGFNNVTGLEGCKGEDAGTSHCSQSCNFNDITAIGCQDLGKEREEEGGGTEEKFDGDLAARFSLERLTSADLLQSIEGGSVSYRMPVQPLNPSSREFLAMGSENHTNMEADPGTAGPYLFGNSCKREINEINDDDNVHDLHGLSHCNQQKRMRPDDGTWEQTPGHADLWAQFRYLADRGEKLDIEKEKAYTNAQMQMQYMTSLLQRKDDIIQSLEEARLEEAHKRELESCRFEHELRVMARVVYGYKKALKETRSAFAEYRKQFPQGEEPLYKDVGGGGGIVLSTNELERQRLAKEEMRLVEEENMRDMLKEAMDVFEGARIVKFNEYAELIANMSRKLSKLDEEFKLLKKKSTETKTSKAMVE